MSLLKVEDLHTEFKTDQGIVHAVRGVSFESLVNLVLVNHRQCIQSWDC